MINKWPFSHGKHYALNISFWVIAGGGPLPDVRWLFLNGAKS
ncbi:hypothetical protein C8J24_0647 [Sphingomonas aerolata]|uniref:Uncharacterized protein n=1 Tax=Sphingomonas aerolata TaxID=185951 RepID=A0A2T4YTX0_9SPHN|nr:hypothetical protein C8J24_0647 [Sphingomonas aerolata]